MRDVVFSPRQVEAALDDLPHLHTAPGYDKIGYVQVKEAEAMFWDILAQRTLDGIRQKVEHGFVLDTHVDAVLSDVRFSMLLAPLPKPVGAPRRERSRSRGRKGDKNDIKTHY